MQLAKRPGLLAGLVTDAVIPECEAIDDRQ